MSMTRKTFLLLTSCIGFAVGTLALLLPEAVLASKGVTPAPAAAIWVREVGVLLLALGAVAFLVRHHPDSPTMRTLLLGNAWVHIGLFPIELAAWHAGVITRFGGIAPNSLVHLVLAAGFLFFARQVHTADPLPGL
ncbi:hypothetical protein D7V97_08660 [Corallococcus sp. CA053C]|uniref:hypothetical protein n=1 Tax=Corallococcus sp. CA053C TaxID=2316732 RepID=UPI000EA346F2|nr:hypothetical protein [Corallococcus sp. CA053C]RKH12380.1 hypothetical protein D7V97_08660 [Corallococcus sp. CA053C]